MEKRLLLFLFAMLTTVSTWAYYDFEVDGIYYSRKTETTVAVVCPFRDSWGGYSPSYSGDVVIPSSVTYEGTLYSVTEIGSSAFSGCSGLTSVEIPSSVTRIGSSAFSGCSGLTSVEIPSSVTEIGYSAFSGCSGLTSVVIPSGVTEIGSYAFYGCSGLTSVEIPSSVTEIGSAAFYGCSGLTSVVIPSGVTEIGSYAFYGCSGLTSVEIPSGVTEIGFSAFSECSGLTSVAISESVTLIDASAFSGCDNLKYNEYDNGLYLGNSENPYLYLVKAKSNEIISVTINDKTSIIAHSAFSGCSGLTLVEIPSSVTEIGSSAFYGCSGLTSVVIPSSVTRIGNDAFEECSGLTSVEIPSSVTEIGFAAFRDCSVLTSVTISEGVTFIDSYAFQGCYNLTSVTIPSTVTDIGVDAFPNPYDNEECKLSTITLLTKTHSVALKMLGYYGTTADQYQYSGFHSKGYAAVYVADGLLPFYEWFWGQYYNFIEIGDVPNVINGEGGIASIVKVYNNKVDINVDLEEGYSVSEIKVNGKVVYTASASNKSLSVDVFVIKNSETSFTLVGVTADDTIEVAYNKSTPTGVGVIEMQREVKGVYDIYGRKLTAPQRGINIIDGKKVIVK